jgi:disulfide bond formation protein DsbB
MNIYQRIVLIVGAIALVIALLTTPRYFMNEALVRCVAVLGATTLLYFAGMSRKQNTGND